VKTVALSLLLWLALAPVSTFAANAVSNQRNTEKSATNAAALENIVVTAQQAGVFNTLLAALNAADLTATLQGPGPFTVFAPTDAAFNRLPPGTVQFLLLPENKPLLTSILTYHVVGGRVLTSKDVLSFRAFNTVQGGKVRARASFGVARVNTSPISAVDVRATNGIIHVIDTVLMPQDAMPIIEQALGVKLEQNTPDSVTVNNFESNSVYADFAALGTQSAAATIPGKPFDFFGEGRTNFTTARVRPAADPNNSEIVWQSVNSANTNAQSFSFGSSTFDSLTPNDFTGDGTFDVNVWRSTFAPNTPGNYFVRTGATSFLNIPWGLATDVAGLEADYDGDGRADPTIVRDVNGNWEWSILGSTAGFVGHVTFGSSATDVPLPGADYNGDGRDDIALVRVGADGTATYLTGGTLFVPQLAGRVIRAQQWGDFDSDYFITGNFVGDARADFAVWRGFGEGANGTWYILENGGNNAFTAAQFGVGGANPQQRDVPLRADFDGDGRQDIAVFRPSSSSTDWFWLNSSNNAFNARRFGQTGDFPVPSLGIR
jgi:uncharacterized surface protein with fasciclin (FAS1) repeats